MPQTKPLILALLMLTSTLVGCLGDSGEEVEIIGIPDSSASAVTSPPLNMDGINTHSEVFGTGADPNMITLGPTVGGQPGWLPYDTKTSMEFELSHGEPVLAPIDMHILSYLANQNLLIQNIILNR